MFCGSKISWENLISPCGYKHSRHKMSILSLVTDVIDAYDVATHVLHGLVASDVRRTKNRHLAVERLTLLDFNNGFAGGVENGTNSPSAAVRFRHTGGNANVLFSALHEERRSHPFAIFLAHCVDDVEIVVDFGGAEIQSGSIFATDSLLSFELGRTQFRSHCL